MELSIMPFKNNNKNKSNNKSAARLIAIGLILITAILLVDMRVRPIIQKAGGY